MSPFLLTLLLSAPAPAGGSEFQPAACASSSTLDSVSVMASVPQREGRTRQAGKQRAGGQSGKQGQGTQTPKKKRVPLGKPGKQTKRKGANQRGLGAQDGKRAQNARGQKAGKAAGAARAAGAGGQQDPVARALEALERKAISGQATEQDFAGVGDQLAGAADETRGKRLRRTVADLARRAKTSSLSAEDMAVLREQWVDTRLDRALEGLEQRAASERLSREDFAPLSALLQERAQAAKAIDPAAGASRKRLQASVNKLQQRAAQAQVTRADFADLEADLNSARVERALADLERRSLSKKASEEDVARVADRLDDQAKGPRVDPKLAEKLRRAISALEGRALRGEVTREEFAELREALTRRARNAATKRK